MANNSASKVSIKIDGRVYGAYGYIRVSPVISKDNKRLRMNVRTFCPILNNE